jgi:hypothetical protein
MESSARYYYDVAIVALDRNPRGAIHEAFCTYDDKDYLQILSTTKKHHDNPPTAPHRHTSDNNTSGGHERLPNRHYERNQ